MFLEGKIKPGAKSYIPLFLLMVLVIISVIAGYVAIENRDKSFTNTSLIMGLQVHQTLYGNDSELAVGKVREKLEEIEDKLSYDIDGSDIDRINRGSGEKWVKSSSETIMLLDKFIRISKKSYGLIDPTVLPLVLLWGFDSLNTNYPSQDEISSALNKINYKDIKINYDVSRVKVDNPGMAVTLKQIEKGSACGEAINIYKNLRIDYGIISIGGVVGVYGSKPDKSLWKISVRDPFVWEREDTKIASVKINDGFVASFGVRDDKINVNGVDLKRLLSTRSGYPIENDIALVSVLHGDPIVAEALSHICCILGWEDSISILNYYGAEAVFVYNDKKITVTPNIKGNFTIIDPSYTIK